LTGCLLAVHEYSFFGSESMTSESQWVSAFKGEVGNYSDRTVCTEWGAPMSPGSKNGKNYDTLDYSTTPTNYFEAYLRGMSSQLKAWNMGSFYWPGLRDGDWYSMTTKSGTGANITLSIPNQSGLQQLQNAWTGPAPTADAGAGGAAGRDGGAAGGAGGTGGSSSGSDSGGAVSRGGAGGATSSAGGSGGAAPGTGGADAAAGGSGSERGGQSGSGGAVATGGASAGSGGAIAATGGAAGGSSSTSNGGGAGTTAHGSGGVGSGGTTSVTTTRAPGAGGDQSSGCSCAIGATSHGLGHNHALLLGLVAVALRLVRRRPRSNYRPWQPWPWLELGSSVEPSPEKRESAKRKEEDGIHRATRVLIIEGSQSLAWSAFSSALLHKILDGPGFGVIERSQILAWSAFLQRAGAYAPT
jgi:MYXO-CTERM domain-containing protein